MPVAFYVDHNVSLDLAGVRACATEKPEVELSDLFSDGRQLRLHEGRLLEISPEAGLFRVI